MARGQGQQQQAQQDGTTGGLVVETDHNDGEFDEGRQEAQDVGQQQPVVIEEPQPQQTTSGSGGRMFTEEEVNKIRREEKDKLYGEIESTKERLARLERERQEEQDAIAEQQRQAEEAERRAREEEMSAKELIASKEQEWNERFARIEEERAAERAIAEREREFMTVQNYIGEQRAMHAEHILPELLDLVTGATKEEVDRSVTTLVERTESILSNMTQAQQQQRMEGQRGPSVTAPPVGPSDNQQDFRSFTAEDIKNMPMSEYVKYRDRMLQSAGSQVSERGLYN
jgi:hypothetical protein